MNFFFYDLETSGLDKANAHIMQFAGQRTDENFNPIGEAVNIAECFGGYRHFSL